MLKKLLSWSRIGATPGGGAIPYSLPAGSYVWLVAAKSALAASTTQQPLRKPDRIRSYCGLPFSYMHMTCQTTRKLGTMFWSRMEIGRHRLTFTSTSTPQYLSSLLFSCLIFSPQIIECRCASLSHIGFLINSTQTNRFPIAWRDSSYYFEYRESETRNSEILETKKTRTTNDRDPSNMFFNI